MSDQMQTRMKLLHDHAPILDIKKTILWVVMLIGVIYAKKTTGLVLDNENVAIPGALVEFIVPNTDNVRFSDSTDSKGLFDIDKFVHDYYLVRVSANGYPTQWFSSYGNTVYPMSSIWVPHDLNIYLSSSPVDNPPNSVIKVSLLDSSGIRYTGDAKITLNSEDNIWNISSEEVQTGAVVVLSNLQPACYSVYIETDDYPPQYIDSPRNSVTPKFQCLEKGDTLRLECRLTNRPKDLGNILGVCYIPNGIPAKNTVVSLYNLNDTSNAVDQRYTGSDGLFWFDYIKPGKYYLKVAATGYPAQWYSFARSKTTIYADDFLNTSEALYDTLSVSISYEPLDNTPNGVVMVVLRDVLQQSIVGDCGATLINANTGNSYQLTFVSDSGFFKVSKIPYGWYYLHVYAKDYKPQYYTPDGGSLHNVYTFMVDQNSAAMYEVQLRNDLVEEPTIGYLSFTITGEGHPIKDAVVNIYSDSDAGLVIPLATDTNGKIAATQMKEAQYHFVIESPSFEYDYSIVNGVVLNRASMYNFYLHKDSTVHFNIELEYNSQNPDIIYPAISGVVRDENSGFGIARCKVLLLDKTLRETSISSQDLWSKYNTFTDDSGRYLIEGVEPGEYIVAAEADSQNYSMQFAYGNEFISSAHPVSIQSQFGATYVDFYLRKGGVITGIAKDFNGNGLAGADILIKSNSDGRYFNALSKADGSFMVMGVPAGTWSIYGHHNLYMLQKNQYVSINVNAGKEHSTTIFFEPGGFFTAKLKLNPEDRTVLEKIPSAKIQLFKDSPPIDQIFYPAHLTIVSLSALSNENSTIVNSNICYPGNYRMVFSPEPMNRFGVSDSVSLLPGLGWTFPDNTTFGVNNKFTIKQLDTLREIPFTLRKGYSVFGSVYAGGVQIKSNYGVEAYVNINGQYVQVSSSDVTVNGKFELPGLVPGENYYLRVWAEGCPVQYWSPNGNSYYPQVPYVFDLSSFSPPVITLDKNVVQPDNSSPLSLRIEKNSAGLPVLKWTDHSGAIDTFKVYSRDHESQVKLLATIRNADKSVSHSYPVNITSNTSHFIITGARGDLMVRSNTVSGRATRLFDSPYEIQLDVFNRRDRIMLEWEYGDSVRFSEKDSVSIYRKTDNESWILLEKRMAYHREMVDYRWSKNDSGKMFSYKIELNDGLAISNFDNIKIDNAILSKMSNIRMVGIYEQYKTIQDAVNAANDFDVIMVKSGTYKEKIDFKGKYLYMEGRWDYGKPPIIDAGGDTAIKIPIYNKYYTQEASRISGFKIQNAKAAVFSAANIDIYNCLFLNVAQSMVAQPDSVMLSRAIVNNPFIPVNFKMNAFQCTFIAATSGDIVANIVSGSVLDTANSASAGYLFANSFINPLISWFADVHIERSIICQYLSRAGQRLLPVKRNGSLSNISLVKNNIYETSVVLPNSQIQITETVNINPAFKDTDYYLLEDNSALQKLSIGFGTYSNGESSNQPSVIKNLDIRILSMNSIGLKWSPSQDSERISSYVVYRIPGDTSLFFINQDGAWDVKLSGKAFDTVVTKFKTDKTYFIDQKTTSGKPYLYAVAAIDSNGNEGKPNIASTSHISQYFVNLHENKISLSAQKWYMIGCWGMQPLNPRANTTIFHWDDMATGNRLLSQYLESTQLQPMMGYWCKVPKDTVLTIKSSSVSGLAAIQDTLKFALKKGSTGWNQIASPFPFTVYPSWVNDFTLWEWNADSLGYKRADSLKPWNAYWVYVERDTNLVILNKTWPVDNKKLYKKSRDVLWEMNISLHGKNAWDNDNKFGVVRANLLKTTSMESPEPPQAFGSRQLFFLKSSEQNSDAAQQEQRLSSLYKKEAKPAMEWTIGISPSDHKAVAKVEGVSDLPEETFAFWINGNDVQDLKLSNQVEIEPHNSTRYAYVLVTSDKRSIAMYSRKFGIRAPYPNPFKGSTRIEYTIPHQYLENGLRSSDQGVMINLCVFNIAGQKVKTLVNGKVGAGSYSCVWNGTDDNMNKVAAGFYVIRLMSPKFMKTVKLFKVK